MKLYHLLYIIAALVAVVGFSLSFAGLFPAEIVPFLATISLLPATFSHSNKERKEYGYGEEYGNVRTAGALLLFSATAFRAVGNLITMNFWIGGVVAMLSILAAWWSATEATGDQDLMECGVEYFWRVLSTGGAYPVLALIIAAL